MTKEQPIAALKHKATVSVIIVVVLIAVISLWVFSAVRAGRTQAVAVPTEQQAEQARNVFAGIPPDRTGVFFSQTDEGTTFVVTQPSVPTSLASEYIPRASWSSLSRAAAQDSYHALYGDSNFVHVAPNNSGTSREP